MEYLTENQLRAALIYTCDLMIASEPMLTELDSIIGDGDHGIGMRDGFSDLKDKLVSSGFNSIYELLMETGTQLVKSMGGASGVIFGTLFIGGREAVKGKDRINADDLILFFEESAINIARRGRTGPGDRTMLDALLPAIDSMKESRKLTKSIEVILEAAYKGALRGVENTKNMIPRLGRAKNFREKAIGYADPGAVSLSVIFKGLSEGIRKINRE
ncbi:MAG TPA: dihydroxyacetone kinase subunit L [Clostridiaceae bacterium]|nr:dihydroxyacetone kinase subunit L [Clostridiaceae bacterium]